MIRPSGASPIAGFDAALPITRARMPPASWYVSPEMSAAEAPLFQRAWWPVARRADVAPGSYVAGCIGRLRWLVSRDETGSVRAFHNVCRHKGHAVVPTGPGCGAALTCGYHGWQYDLDGRLRKAPRMAGIEDFDRDAMGLLPLQAAEWGPWIWLREAPPATDPPSEAPSTPAVSSPAEQAPEIARLLDASGWEALRFVAGRSWAIPCNWKVFVDNYLDGGYHIENAHPSLAAQLAMDDYTTSLYHRSSLQRCRPDGASRDLDYDVEARIGNEALYAWLYPHVMLNRYGPCLDLNLVVPLGPDQCRVDYEIFFAADVDEDFIATSIRQTETTQEEDVALCTSVQAGLTSGAYVPGPYAPRVELAEHHFHRLLAEDLLAEDLPTRDLGADSG